MGADKTLKTEAPGERRTRLTALYGIIMTSALELGEIARMEIEIQKICALPPPQPRCPCWHTPPSAQSPYIWPH